MAYEDDGDAGYSGAFGGDATKKKLPPVKGGTGDWRRHLQANSLASAFEERAVLAAEGRGVGAILTATQTSSEPLALPSNVSRDSGRMEITERPREAVTASSNRFWKPGTIAPGTEIEREEPSETQGAGATGSVVAFNPYENMSLRQQRLLLPVYSSRREILYALEKFQTVVIVGETGSGKTTQIPQYLHEAGWTAGHRSVVVTQPRRVAATTIASRVAEEMNVQLGQEVGYTVKFDDNSDRYRTRIKYVTDGVLVREMMLDPLLSRYSVVMLDEAHERSLNTDVLLGLMKKILRKRKDLRLIISSATLDALAFKRFFESNTSVDGTKDTAVIVNVEGRQFPVELYYTKKSAFDYVQAAVDTVFYIHSSQPPGDILVFLTGQEEIEKCVAMINTGDTNLQAIPLYASLPHEQQLRAFRPGARNVRKCVVATNVAETSVTIPGIVYVVDSGFAKLIAYNPRSGMESLVVTPISRASANQRAGRAGRVRPGKCFRLYPEKAYLTIMAERTVPEMQRANLASVVLQLKALGIDDVLHFDFMSPPHPDIMRNALELLYSLNALDAECKLTRPLGATIAEFPVEPRMAKMLIESGKMGCSEEILSIAAMLSVQDVFVNTAGRAIRGKAEVARKKFTVYEGDHLTLLNVFNAFLENGKDSQWCQEHFLNYKALRRASEIRRDLRRYLVRFNIPIIACQGTNEIIRKCIVCGYFANAAQLQPNGTYTLVRSGLELAIHPSSTLIHDAPKWVVFHDVVITNKRYMRDLTVIQPLWLSELAPHFYEYKGAKAHVTAEQVAKAREKPVIDLEAPADDGVTITEQGRTVKHRRLF